LRKKPLANAEAEPSLRKGVSDVQNPGLKDREGDTQMMHPDHYYLLVSFLGYEVGFALIFAVRFTELLFDYISPPYLSPAYLSPAALM